MSSNSPTTNQPPGLFKGRPAFKTLVLYSAGIVCGNYMPIIPVVALFITIALAITAWIFHFRKNSLTATILISITLFMCGAVQYKIAVSGFPPTHIKKIAEKASAVTVKGEIVEEPDIRTDRTYLVVEVDSLTWRKRDLQSSGRILVKIKEPSTAFSFRDRIKFTGYLFTPGGPRIPGGFDFARYLNFREIFGMIVLRGEEDIDIYTKPPSPWWSLFKFWSLDEIFINKIFAPVRKVMLDGFYKYLPAEHASLLAGFILGEKRNIPEDIARLFRDTGTFHLMAVSGSNVGIVVIFLLFVLKPVNRRLKIILILCAILFFSFLTRNEPSVVRASVMASVVLLGFYRQRNADTIGLLGFAGLLLLILKPLWLFNVGFQLSVAACAGILYFLPKFNVTGRRSKSIFSRRLNWILIVFITTISAQIAVLPLSAHYFNRLPLVGILANIPMIALAGILTVAGLVFLPFIILGNTIAVIFAWPLKELISIIFPLLDFFAGLPMAVLSVGSPGLLKLILFYCVLYVSSELFFAKRFSLKGAFIVLAALSGLIWISYLKGPKTETLTFIDCGPDRAVLYNSNEGKNYLWYDCHEDSLCRRIELNLLPYLYKGGISRIDTVFTEERQAFCAVMSELEIGGIVNPDDLVDIDGFTSEGTGQHNSVESILNKRVKFVCYKSDNNSEPLKDGYYYKLETEGGVCLLAGGVSPHLAGRLWQSVFLLELPWSVQPYGVVFENLKKYTPGLLVFSPGKGRYSAIRDRQNLTYMNDEILAASIIGTFRIRFCDDQVKIDYMIED